jgi:hypothetical protein
LPIAQLLLRYRYLVGLAAIHLTLIVVVCLRDTFGIFSEAPTIFPSALNSSWRNAGESLSIMLGEELGLKNPARNAVAVYLHAAGIEAGYGFFAPNVPSNYKLVFEVRYPDNHVEYELPEIGDAATAFRLESLLDRIADLTYEEMRQVMLQMLTRPVWQKHPDATAIRVVMGYTIWPSPKQFQAGQRETFDPVLAYDFDLRPANTTNRKP